MNNMICKGAVAIIATAFVFTQTVYWSSLNLSNGLFLNYFSKKKLEDGSFHMNETLDYQVELEVLENPLTVDYIPDIKNTRLVKLIKKYWLQVENYNYLGSSLVIG